MSTGPQLTKRTGMNQPAITAKPELRRLCRGGCNEIIPNIKRKARPGADICIPCQQIEDRQQLKYRT
ncbi:MAG: hypothetical protein OQJ91_02895 [Motiliproteus sp.]|nr:hypothetical protein [Motiliproteus sp.]